MNTRSRWLAWTSGTTIAASIAALAAHGYLGSYSRFMADDYCSASEANRLGIFRAAWYWYITWTGRYSANFADAVFGKLGPNFTPAVPSIVVLAWLGTLGITIYLLLPTEDKRLRLLLTGALATTILFLTLTLTANIEQSLYWSQGMRSVVPPLILGSGYVALLRWFQARPRLTRSRLVWSAIGLLLTYAAGGFSETYTVFQVAAFLLAIAVLLMCRRYASNKDIFFFLASGSLGALLALITVVVAPGNPYRQAYFSPLLHCRC